ncbi:MAG: hypothetical protein AB7G39_06190 [Alphaproteobacteria bacterium]
MSDITSAAATELSRLPWAERFLVWSVRTWVALQKAGQRDHSYLYEAFRRGGMPDGYGALDAMLTHLAQNATGCIEVQCQRCQALGEGERDLLMAAACVQHGDLPAARRTLGGLVGAAGTGPVLDAVIWLVAEMSCAGMTFRLPHAQPFAPASLRLH